jgi:hypothetical protein
MSRRLHSAKPSNAILVNLPWHTAEGRFRPNISISPQHHESHPRHPERRKRPCPRFGQDNMGCLVGEARVGDFALRSDLAHERQNAGGVGQDGTPVLFVPRIYIPRPRIHVSIWGSRSKESSHVSTQTSFSVGSLDVAVQRQLQSCNYFSHTPTFSVRLLFKGRCSSYRGYFSRYF